MARSEIENCQLLDAGVSCVYPHSRVGLTTVTAPEAPEHRACRDLRQFRGPFHPEKTGHTCGIVLSI